MLYRLGVLTIFLLLLSPLKDCFELKKMSKEIEKTIEEIYQ